MPIASGFLRDGASRRYPKVPSYSLKNPIKYRGSGAPEPASSHKWPGEVPGSCREFFDGVGGSSSQMLSFSLGAV